jgi:hypothetical protein
MIETNKNLFSNLRDDLAEDDSYRAGTNASDDDEEY